MSDGIAVLSPDWEFTFVNAPAAEILGIPPGELLGRNHWEVFPDLAGTPLEAAYRRARSEQRPAELEYFYPRLQRWLHLKAHPWSGGLTVCFNDITHRRQPATSEQVTEERFRLAASSRYLTLYEQDRDLRYTWLYPTHPEHAHALGRTDEELQPDGSARALVELKRYVMQTGLELRREIEAFPPSGPRHYDLFIAPRRAPDGAVIGVAGAALDITDRIRAEQALRQSEERLRTTYDHAPVGIVEVALDGRVLAANALFCALLGYRREELLGRRMRDLTHPDDVASTLEKFERLLRGQVEFYNLDKRYLHKSGRTVWVSLTVSLVRNERGAGTFAVAIAQDVSARKRADDDRRRLAAIVASSDDAILSKNTAGLVQSWNGGAERMYGFTAAEMIGQPISRIIPPERHAEERELLAQLQASPTTARYDTVRLHRDGRRIHVALTVSPLYDGHGAPIGVSSIARDITAARQAAIQQQALYALVASVNRADALEEVYAAALDALQRTQETSRTSILLYDDTGTMRFAAWRGLSDAYRQAVEGHSPWTRTERQPRPIWIQDATTDPLAKPFAATLEREGIRALAFIPLTYENELLGKFMVYFDAPRPVAPDALQVAETIARQVGIAIARRRAALALESLVTERTASLREAMEQMEEFSYSVSHDLRAPIRALANYADVLLEDHDAELQGDVREFLYRIRRNARHMDALVRDTLAYSRVTRRELTFTDVPLRSLCDDVITALDLPADQTAIVCDPELGCVRAHEPSLAQALGNLLSNAIKFVAPGVTPEVRVYSETNDGWVRLWIADNGIGIRPELHARLFGMFERLHPDRRYDGTGIGLAIVRKAVERMGGRVGVESDGQHGSRFWLELPAAESRPQASAAASA